MEPIVVLGAGAWGTALAIHLARQGHAVHLWGHAPAQMAELAQAREHASALPGTTFPSTLVIESDWDTALAQGRDILIAVPSEAFSEVVERLASSGRQDFRLICSTKGLNPVDGQLLHTVVHNAFATPVPYAVLSGPSFAKEVAKGLPTAVTVATQDSGFAQDLQGYFHSKYFRLYTCDDLIGVQIAGAMKNALAIAVGMSDGMGFGANARSALITRGLAEITRLACAMGAKPATLTGLSGLGDLVLTCTDDQSRNRRFGLALAAGQSTEEAAQAIGQVVEGAKNVKRIVQLATQHGVELPICEQVARIINEGLAPGEALDALLSREAKQELL